jgi:hypothetical protein
LFYCIFFILPHIGNLKVPIPCPWYIPCFHLVAPSKYLSLIHHVLHVLTSSSPFKVSIPN